MAILATGGAIKALPPKPGLWLHLSCKMRGDGSYNGKPARATVENNVMNRCRLQIFYAGTVQGVGFRYSVKTLAHGFELTGTVRNLPDGRVELVVEGARGELSAFQQAIRESELGHFIRKEEVAWLAPLNDLRGFEIVR